MATNNNNSSNDTKSALMASMLGGSASDSPQQQGAAVNNDNDGGDDLFGDIDLNSPEAQPQPSPPAVVPDLHTILPAVSSNNGLQQQQHQQQQQPQPLATPMMMMAPAPPPPAAAETDPMFPLAAAAPPPAAAAVAPPSSATSNMLMQSGLLGTTTATTTHAAAPAPTAAASSTSLLSSSSVLFASALGGDTGSSGLFDDVDEEEKQAAAAAAAAAAAEAKRLQLEREAEAQRQIQLQQQQQQLQAQQQQQLLAQQQQQQQQMLQDQMQSIHLGNSYMQPQPPPLAQQQQVPVGFYREHPPVMEGGYGQQPAFAHQQQQQPQFMQQQQQQPQQQAIQQNRYYHPQQQPSISAGMHNGRQHASHLGQVPQQARQQQPNMMMNGGGIQRQTPQPPSMYQKIIVSEPVLIQPSAVGGLLGGLMGGAQPAHWSYQITTHLVNTNTNNNSAATAGYCWYVRRRFRHVVALEDRLREDVPGAILPPRPDKHATRAIEEATALQSAEFALQRAVELQIYLNQVISHPCLYQSQVLRLFLSLQDDLGTAWPEVSSNALTRLANVGVGAAMKVSETTQTTKFPWQDPLLSGHVDDYGEENAELLALSGQEQVRMGAVLQAVPKLEGAVTLMREGAEMAGATGMELSRLAKEVVQHSDRELGQPIDIVATGLLRSGRRSKRLALELSAALNTYHTQYKLCRYEKLAFQDRRVAIMRRHKERGRADHRAAQLMQQQRLMYQQQQAYNNPHYPQQQQYNNPQFPQYQNNNANLDSLERNAVLSDTCALEAVDECEEIGRRLKQEVYRVALQRRQDWNAAVKVVASSCKEAVSEKVAIWTSVRESFLQAFPEYNTATTTTLQQQQQAPMAAPPGAAGGVGVHQNP